MESILNYIELPLSKKDFTISKIDNTDYKSNIGNFSKHLAKHGHTIESYTLKYYPEYLPKCLETGVLSDNKIKGHWNYYVPLCKSYTDLSRKVKVLENVVNRIKQDHSNYITEYLDFRYWIDVHGMKLSEAADKIYHFVRFKQKNLYQRLSYNYYDTTWAKENIDIVISEILNGGDPIIYSKWSKKGIIQRGTNYVSEYNTFYKSKPCAFRDTLIQKHNSFRRQEKYGKEEQKKFSVRCIEYWLSRGYSLDESIQRVSEIQKLNTVESISKRHRCTLDEAMAIQFDIYQKRRETFSLKSDDEILDINLRKDSGSFEYCMRKCNYDLLKAKELYHDLKQRRCVPFGKASKESLKYFIPLYKFLRKNNINRHDIYIGVSGSNEYWLRDLNKNLFFMYDFTILSHKLIFEYDGIKWHVDDEKDLLKERLASDNGFAVFRIKSDWTDEEKFNFINNILNEKIQINNPNWGTVRIFEHK